LAISIGFDEQRSQPRKAAVDPGPNRAGRAPAKLRDLGRPVIEEVAKSDRRALIDVQFLQRFDELVRNHVASELVGEPVRVLVARGLFDQQLGASAPPSQQINPAIGGDPLDPRAQLAVGIEPRDRSDRGQDRLLRDVFRRTPVLGEEEGDSVGVKPMPLDQLPDRFGISCRYETDELSNLLGRSRMALAARIPMICIGRPRPERYREPRFSAPLLPKLVAVDTIICRHPNGAPLIA
jgi:hypothetical protein